MISTVCYFRHRRLSVPANGIPTASARQQDLRPSDVTLGFPSCLAQTLEVQTPPCCQLGCHRDIRSSGLPRVVEADRTGREDQKGSFLPDSCGYIRGRITNTSDD